MYEDVVVEILFREQPLHTVFEEVSREVAQFQTENSMMKHVLRAIPEKRSGSEDLFTLKW